MKKNISGPISGPVGTRNSSGPDGPNAVMAPVTESQVQNIHRKDTVLSVIEISKHKINIINDHCFIISLSCIRNHTDQLGKLVKVLIKLCQWHPH